LKKTDGKRREMVNMQINETFQVDGNKRGGRRPLHKGAKATRYQSFPAR